MILALIPICCLLYAYFIEPNRLVVNQQKIAVKGWNRTFNGLKIAAISDIHGGSNSITEEKLRKIVDTANAQNPDLIVLLGDFVSQQRDDRTKLKMSAATIGENLKGFRAKFGVFAVLGNHDGWYNDEIVKTELEKAGIRVLENEIVPIEKDGQTFRILGLKDQMKLVPNWKKLAEELKKLVADDTGTGDLVVLEHSPDILPRITGELLISKDLKLILSGHTHGGQVWFPVLGTPIVPSSYGQTYSYGHIRENDVDMFVTSGIGTSILPIRFMMPPEIAVLEIEAE